MHRFGLLDPLKQKIKTGLPVFGTCAGAILLAETIIGRAEFKLGLLKITAARNAYGRQVDSFEADLDIPAVTETPFRSVFIRAPIITATAAPVTVLASFQNLPVLVRQENILAATFHPELTADPAVHKYFIKMAEQYKPG